MKQNFFIAFEGIDGSGKSTQIKFLSQKLSNFSKAEIHLGFEPTKNRIGQMIREAFTGQTPLDNRVIAALFVADRLQHILAANTGLMALLQKGMHVLLDRYYISSYAYQGALVDLDWVINANSKAVNLCKPDLHIFLDLAPEVAFDRIRKGRAALELYETLDNLAAVRAKYFEAFEKIAHQERVAIIDANADEATVAERVWKEVEKLF